MDRSDGPGKLIPVLAVMLLIIIVVVVVAVSAKGGGKEEISEIEYGVGVLRQMESGNPDDVVAVIRQQQRDRLLAEGEEYESKLISGEIDVWSQFQDYVILGDSRGTGFSYFDFLPWDRNLSVGSATIYTFRDSIPDIVALAPSRVYITYGVNDINIGFWPTVEDYVADFTQFIGELQEELPDVEIYVNSILEVQEAHLSDGEKWKYIPDWNVSLRQMCLDNGYTFVDNSSATAEHQDLYSEDGVHFTPGFYRWWAINMIMATYYRAVDEAVAS